MNPPGPSLAPLPRDDETAGAPPRAAGSAIRGLHRREPAELRTPPRSRAFQVRKVALIAAAILLATGALGAAMYARLQWALDTPLDSGGAPREVAIRRGEGLREVEARLEAQGVLARHSPLALWGRLTGRDRRIRAGLYVFTPAQWRARSCGSSWRAARAVCS